MYVLYLDPAACVALGPAAARLRSNNNNMHNNNYNNQE